jgi:hypothetical protein
MTTPRLGLGLDALTRVWVRVTGRRVDMQATPWLEGPTGDVDRVGHSWLERERLRWDGRYPDLDAEAGLLTSMALLDGPGFSADDLRPEVRDFYERTSRWRLQVWAQWSPWAWPFGWLVSALFARRLEQLALPLRPLEVARGMSSDVRPVIGIDGRVIGTAWLRRLRGTGRTVFSGWYGVSRPPASSGPSVRVVFPLPHGRLVVLLRPRAMPDGSLLLTSTDAPWGGDGAYLVVQPSGRGRGWARRIPVHEVFHVHVDDEGVLRTDHEMRLWRLPVLQLHYRLDPAD